MNKQCFKCRETKPISEFYKHSEMGDGHLGKCKTCTKRDSNERIEKVKKDPDWLFRERERCRIKQERYRKLGVLIPTRKETKVKWEKSNRHKKMAELQAKRALERGIIKNKYKCEWCNKSGVRLENHHEDYSKPLDVIFLCSTCHGLTRRKDQHVCLLTKP